MKLLHRLLTDAPLISDGSLCAILKLFGPATTIDPMAAESPYVKSVRERLKPQMTRTDDGIAIVPVEGTLARKPDAWELFYGFEDTANIHEMVNAAAEDPRVKGILLNVDSPGGFLTGGPEVADAIKEAAKRKPVEAWTGGEMASLAYWIGSSAQKVTASPSAIVGSIGVFATHVDYSRMYDQAGIKVEVIKNKEGTYKAAGAMGTSLNDAQRDHLQQRIQASFGEFRAAVQGNRPGISDDVMKGQTFYGKEAKSVGLVDRVGDMNFALLKLRESIRKTG